MNDETLMLLLCHFLLFRWMSYNFLPMKGILSMYKLRYLLTPAYGLFEHIVVILGTRSIWYQILAPSISVSGSASIQHPVYHYPVQPVFIPAPGGPVSQYPVHSVSSIQYIITQFSRYYSGTQYHSIQISQDLSCSASIHHPLGRSLPDLASINIQFSHYLF